MPAWADEAILSGEPNAYFNAEQAARSLSTAQRAGLGSLIHSVEQRLSGPGVDGARALADRLLRIAVRVQAGISSNAGQAWAAALVASLSKTPVDLLERAVDAASYEQFQYLNEVGPFIQKHAADPWAERNRQLNRLREIDLKARSLPKPGTGAFCTAEEAAKIIDSHGLRKAKADRPAERPEVNWDAEMEKRLRTENFLRQMAGKASLSMLEYTEEQAIRNRAALKRQAGWEDDDVVI